MNHLRQAWARRVEGYSGPVGGIGLKDLWDGQQGALEVRVETVLKPFGEPLNLAFQKAPWGTNFKALLASVEQEARKKARGLQAELDRWQVIRYVLLASGKERHFVGEKASLDDQWSIPSTPVQLSHNAAEPDGTFLRMLHYETNDEVSRYWAEWIMDVPYDDRQFDLIEGKPHVIVYRGISLPAGANPATAAHPDTGGTGYSWTLSEETAIAIAERGGAGFSGDNRPGQQYMVRARDMEKVPTVLRAEVVLSGEAAKPYRPWNYSYRSELEVDVPKGTPIVMTGWKQAKGKILNQKLYDRAHDPNTDPYSLEAYWYIQWQWGPWHTGSWSRTAATVQVEQRSRLDYDSYRVNARIALVEGTGYHPEATGGKEKMEVAYARWRAANPGRRMPDSYKDPTRWVSPGYSYFTSENASPGTVAFIDLEVGSTVRIAYMAVRPDKRGQGLARRLIQETYDRYPNAPISWGKLMQVEMGHLYDSFRGSDPDRTIGGRPWF